MRSTILLLTTLLSEASWAQRFNPIQPAPHQGELNRMVNELEKLPPGLSSLFSICSWKRTFHERYHTNAFMDASVMEIKQRRFLAALTEWKSRVAGTEVELLPVLMRRQEVESLFAEYELRHGPMFEAYYSPLRQLENRLAGRLKLSGPVEKTKPAALAVKSLLQAEFFLNVHLGKFDLASSNHAVNGLFTAYVNQYGAACPNHLPNNAVPITEAVCTHEYVRTGRCADWTTRSTGVFADPRFYQKSRALGARSGAEILSSALSGASARDPLSAITNAAAAIAKTTESNAAEIRGLLAQNPCGSPQLNHFAENFLRLVSDEAPLGTPDGGPVTETCRKSIGTLSREAPPSACGCLESLYAPVPGQQAASQRLPLTPSSQTDLSRLISDCLERGTGGRQSR